VRLTLAPLTNFDVGALAASVVAFIAFRANALDGGGALAAFAVGTATFGSLGFRGAALLLAFFVSSVFLSRVGAERKRALDAGGKSGARDAGQVLANGGVAALCALLALTVDGRYAAGFAGALAAATADTWGTEIGALAAGRPRSIVTFRPVAAGLSGGVTFAGTLAELGGALAIAGIAYALDLSAFVTVLAAGFAGALVDSILGGTVQALRFCPQCRRACESDPHACGANARLVRGVGWVGNDAVNFACSLTGAVLAFALAR
jgi:uncharacterized protein (TIGR00297 family)